MLSAALSGPTGANGSGGSPLLRNTTVPQGGAGIRLHKTLSLGEKKQAVALPVVSISLPPFSPASTTPTTDPLRRFPPPTSSATATTSSTSSSSTNTTATSKVGPPLHANDGKPRQQQPPQATPGGPLDDHAAGITAKARKQQPKEAHSVQSKESTAAAAAGRNYIIFPSLAEMADTEAGKKASLSLSDGAPSVQFRRHFLFPEAGAALFSNLTTQACWVDDREGSTGRAPSKFAWFGDSRSELSSGGVVIKHEEWTRIPLLSELRDKLETEFHTTFNAVHCSYFRNGSECSGGCPDDPQSQKTDAVFVCLGQKRNLLLSPKARQDCGTSSKLPHVRVVMEANAALFVHLTARSLYDYSVPQSEELVTGGNIMLCFRRLAATPKNTTPTVAGRDPLRSSQSRTEGSQAGDKTKTPSGKGNTAARNAPTSAKNVIYIDEDDEVLDSQREASTSVKTDDLQDYVGRIFSSRHDLYSLGLHMTYTTSICGNMEKGADSILLSDPAAPPVNERLLYTCVNNSHENQIERAVLQINVLNDIPVRLVRGWRADYETKSSRSSDKDDERMWYRYDGLYSVRHYVDEPSRDDGPPSGRGEGPVFCEFLLTRLPLYPTPPLPPMAPKRSEPPKPTLPSISSLTSLPPPSSFRDARKIDLRQGDYLSRDYDDDDGVEIIEVKHASQPPHHLHPTSTSSSSSTSQHGQQPRQLLPPTSSLLNPSASSSPLRRLSGSEPPSRMPTSYSQLMPASSPQRQHPQQQQQQQQHQQHQQPSSIPLPGILPYMKTAYSGPSPPSSAGGSSKLGAPPPPPPASLSLPLPPLPPSHAASLQPPPPSPSNSSNLNAAMLMYNLFGVNPVMPQAPPGLAALYPAVTPYPDPQQQQQLSELFRPATTSIPLAPQAQHHLAALAPPPSAVQSPMALQPSLYEVPTAHLLFFMNLIPQKDREIAQIMRQKELDNAKPKRKDESHDKKRKRRSKEEASGTKKKGGSSKSNGRSRRSTVDEEYIDLGLVDNEDDEIINNWSSRRRGAAVQKKSDVEWEKVKELAAAERSVKRKKSSGGGGSSRHHKAEPVDAEPMRPKEVSPNKRSRSDRKGRGAAEGEDEGSVFCICRSSEEYGFMIACDKCNEWFHGGCVGLTPAEGQEMKTYICPRCHPPNPRKKAFPFGDALSFAANGARRSRVGVATKKENENEEDEFVVDEEKIEWNELGEVVYCGDGDMTDDFQSDDPSGFVFVAYGSFDDIAREREEARKTREDYVKKQQQQRYLQQRLQAIIKQDNAATNGNPAVEPALEEPTASLHP